MNPESASKHIQNALRINFPISDFRNNYFSDKKDDLTSRVDLVEALTVIYREMRDFVEPDGHMSLDEQVESFKSFAKVIEKLAPLHQNDDDPEFIDPDELSSAEREREEDFFRKLYGVGTQIVPHVEKLLAAISNLKVIAEHPDTSLPKDLAIFARVEEVFNILIRFYDKLSEPSSYHEREEMNQVLESMSELLGEDSESQIGHDEFEEVHQHCAQAFRKVKKHLLDFCADLDIKQGQS
jgi:hypothetical protein